MFSLLIVPLYRLPAVRDEAPSPADLVAPDLAAPDLAAPDLVAIDLAELAKPDAAQLAADAAAVRRGGVLCVRVAPLGEAASSAQLSAAVALSAGIVVLAGCESGHDVTWCDARLSVQEARCGAAHGRTRIIAETGESAVSLFTLASFRNASPRLAGLAWDARAAIEDLGSENPGAPDLAGTMIGLAARAAGVPAYQILRPSDWGRDWP